MTTALFLILYFLFIILPSSAFGGELTNQFTISIWVNPQTSVASKALVVKDTEIRLVTDASGNPACQIYASAAWQTAITSSTALTTGTWTHVSCTYDKANIRVFVNGVQTGSGAQTNAVNDAATSLLVGQDDSATYANFIGTTDNLMIYSYAQTSKQIVSDMNAGHPAVGSPVGSAIGHWKFDEGVDNTCSGGTNDTCNSGSGGSTLDGAGSGFSSPATATSGWTNSGKFGKALIFDGTDDDVNVGDPSNGAFDFGTSDSFTLTAWIKTSGPTGSSNAQCIICKDVGSLQKSWWFRVSDANVLQFLLSDGTNEPPVSGATTVTTGQWVHVAAVRDITSDTLKVYVNGSQDGSATDTTTSGTENANSVKIGEFNSGSTRQFNGTIDEPKIYRYALTVDELKVDMNRSSSQVLGSLSDKSTPGSNFAAGQEYCVPGDTTTSCAAPVAQWQFDEKQGTSAKDTSGNAYNGTLTSTSTPLPSWTQGKVGSGLSFDGTTNYLTTSTLGSFGSGLGSGATLEFWINTTTTATIRQIGVLNTVNTAYVVDFNRDKSLAASVGKTDFFIRDNDSKILNAEISTNIYDGKWHHIAWSITSPSSNSFVVYVDGVAQTLSYGTQTAPATFSNFQFAFMIGATNNRGTPASFINAKFDQVKIFNYGRSAAQIAWDYNRGAPVGYWKFNECQGATVYDDSRNANGTTNGNNGTITVGASGTQTAVGTCTGSANTMWKDGATGKYNASLDFDGTDDYIKISSNLAINSSFSVGAWVKPTSVTPSVRQIVVSDRLTNADANTNTGFHLILTETTGFPSFGLIGNVGTSDTVPLSSGWHHLLGVYDSSAGTIKLYVDGILKNTTDGASLITSNNPIRISSGIDGASVLRYFDGQIDDTKIYNYALTATQVKTLYNQGGAVRFGPVTGSP